MITHSNPADSINSNPKPYQDELQDATDLARMSAQNQQPTVPSLKAKLQAAGSRQQILDDKEDGGAEILVKEAQEEKEVKETVRRSARRRAASSISQNDSLKGFRDRVTGTAMHGRAGGIIGMESNR